MRSPSGPRYKSSAIKVYSLVEQVHAGSGQNGTSSHFCGP